MNLTRQQVNALRILTNRLQRYCMPDEVMHFSIKEMSRGAVMLCASNSGSPWYAKHKHATLFIGPRGGLDRKHFNLDGLSKSILVH